jgi:hypothetical protein
MDTKTETEILEKAKDRLLNQIYTLCDRDGNSFNESMSLATTVSAYVDCTKYLAETQCVAK